MRDQIQHSDSLKQIDSQFKEQILRIIKYCSVTPEQAFETLLLNDFDVDSSILVLKKEKYKNNIKRKLKIDSSLSVSSNETFNEDFYQTQEQQDSDEEYQSYFYYRNYEKGPKYFYEKYPVNLQLIRIKDSSVLQLKSRDTGLIGKINELKQTQQKLGPKSQNIPKNSVSTLQQAFCRSYHQRMPVLILITDLGYQSVPIINQMFSHQSKIKTIFQEEFIYMGIQNSYIIQEWLYPFIRIKRDLNYILIFQINLRDEIEMIARISLEEQVDKIIGDICKAKKKSIQQNLDDLYIKTKYRMALEGKTLKRPTSYKLREKIQEQQRKVLSDQRIRRQQQEVYKKMQESADKRNQITARQKQQKQKEIEQCLLWREQTKQRLNVYCCGLNFKIRVPSGTNIYVTVPKQQNIQYLYDYVCSRQEDLGFQNQPIRKFNLFIGFGETTSLQSIRNSQIGSQFNDPGFLVVREID